MGNNSNNDDIFRSYLVDGASLCGDMELPVLPRNTAIPSSLIEFRRLKNPNTQNQYIHFYIPDKEFSNVNRNPRQYLRWFKRFAGIIGFDFSIHAECPQYKQIEILGKNRELSYWFSSQGVSVIPNIRWGSKETFKWCFNGFPINSTVAVGALGCLKNENDKELFIAGFYEMIDRLTPTTVVLYGTKHEKLFPPLFVKNTNIHYFESHYTMSHRKGVA